MLNGAVVAFFTEVDGGATIFAKIPFISRILAVFSSGTYA